ncbi:helix-turn-helix domain-containing protein [Cupriavidus campinensis]|uniref:helix-turn-helix domain-containing protein n=1 Tax=Cupriavidus campinensis TaxID=151783 RepID=UPI0021CCA970|nr:AraC family transcriptional regulator [Cupriavidus campinensis]
MRRDFSCADATTMTAADAQAKPCTHAAAQTWLEGDAESEWRDNSRLLREESAAACAWGRWSDRRREPRMLTSPLLDRHYTIEILLSDTVVDCHTGGAAVFTRGGQFGAAQVTPPGERVRCRFERPMESVILYIPTATMHETLHRCGRYIPAGFTLEDPRFRADPILGRFVGALSQAASPPDPSTTLFIEHACRTVIAYLVRAQLQSARAPDRPVGLQAWRLRKVMDFIGANATERITLQAMADHVGLSRMHFAAQFLLATGMTPHTYLTEARLGIAKRLLSEGQLALAAIAVQAGFHSQAHFTNVFRKSTGTTPGRWRAEAMDAAIDRGRQTLRALPFASDSAR